MEWYYLTISLIKEDSALSSSLSRQAVELMSSTAIDESLAGMYASSTEEVLIDGNSYADWEVVKLSKVSLDESVVNEILLSRSSFDAQIGSATLLDVLSNLRSSLL